MKLTLYETWTFFVSVKIWWTSFLSGLYFHGRYFLNSFLFTDTSVCGTSLSYNDFFQTSNCICVLRCGCNKLLKLTLMCSTEVFCYLLVISCRSPMTDVFRLLSKHCVSPVLASATKPLQPEWSWRVAFMCWSSMLWLQYNNCWNQWLYCFVSIPCISVTFLCRWCVIFCECYRCVQNLIFKCLIINITDWNYTTAVLWTIGSAKSPTFLLMLVLCCLTRHFNIVSSCYQFCNVFTC